jgi:hypothetical protein
VSPIRRDGEGRIEIGPTWESLVERQIRDAMDDGAFDDLPFQGERIPIDDDGSPLALAHHVLKQAGVAPDWIQTDREIRELLDRRDAVVGRARRASAPVRERDRAELLRLVELHNALALRLEQQAPTVGQHRRRLDARQEVARLEAAARGTGDDEPC